MNVLQFVTSQGWKYRKSGDELELGCPFEDCPNYNQPQFYINIKTEKWCCKRCAQGGVSLKQLEYKLGLVTMREPVKSHLYISERDIQRMHKALLDNKDAMDYLTNKRMLKSGTIRQFKLGWVEKEKFDSYEGEAIFFPDFKQGVCVGAEYHFYKKEGRNKKIKSGSRSQLFNLDRIDLKQPLFITEGRYDALSGWQYGYKNIGSVPNGADSADGEWTEEIQSAPRYYICSDADSAGFNCSEKFAKKVGRTKCYRVHLEVKDLNEYLVYGISKEELDKVIVNAEPLFTAPVTEIGQYTDAAKQALEDPTLSHGLPTEWQSLNAIIKGIRPGELTTVCGKSGQGKTEFSTSLAGSLIRQGVKCLIISPEMQEQDILIKLAANYNKKPVKKYEELLTFTEKFKDKVYIAPVFDLWTDRKNTTLAEKVLDVIQYSVDNKGVQFVVLDHLRLFAKPKGDKSERESIDAFLQDCLHSAISNKIHILLVAQPRKSDDARYLCKKCQRPVWTKVTADDLKGSSNIEQDSHNVILVHRYLKKYCDCKFNGNMDDTVVEIEVSKNRKFGIVDSTYLKFNMVSHANYYEVKL